MLFSILVANYNNALFLTDLFDSVIHQTSEDWELIFVDDASTDNSYVVAKGYADKNERIKLFQNETNQGVAYTKRKCIELAQGAICGYVDPDDKISLDAIEVMLVNQLKYPKASMVISNFYMSNDTFQNVNKFIYPEEFSAETLLIGLTPNPFTSFKKSFYLQTEGINPYFKRAIDRDLVLKLEEVGEVIHIEDYLYYYRINSNSISNNENAYKAGYWAWQARFDACKRRGINPEELYAKIMYQNDINTIEQVRNSIEYSIGSYIVKILQKLKLLKWVSKKK